MGSLEELAGRVERADGADRELDAEIAVALNIGARGLLPDDHEYLSRVRKDDCCAAGTYWFHCRSGMSLRTAEAYTVFLDAALTLVPEGYGFMLDGYGDDWFADLYAAQGFHANAKTPALALTAACLRARTAASIGSAGE